MGVKVFGSLMALIFTSVAVWLSISSKEWKTELIVAMATPRYNLNVLNLKLYISQKITSRVIYFYLILGSAFQAMVIVLNEFDNTIKYGSIIIFFVGGATIFLSCWYIKDRERQEYEKALSIYCYRGYHCSDSTPEEKSKYIKILVSEINDFKKLNYSDTDLMSHINEKYSICDIIANSPHIE